ncbi:leader peptidase (prepilin peptidase) / N-methyltransferase [Nakamurella panacisegetis]|uniref:Leader peptidase (Prepilin peptidase) / N-methyltransferase n=1 Tax=Nakamurella panacisegetis TaxID=1090615 RepID=A0A1H0HMY9_9ACTN|nr:A24 family peptidase [Nakamurella panacisegetis]SDO20566.1 leader peptidase (prepilin peptidase) / N-methyltransferase [Nakamurella panacisegetis]
MLIALTVAMTIGGIGVGLGLNAVATRLSGTPVTTDERSGLPQPGRRLWLALTVGALFGAVTARIGLSWALPAYLYFCYMAVLLAVIDLRYQRLPNAIVGWSAIASLVLLSGGALGDGTLPPLRRAFVGGAALFLLFLIMALVSPAGIGMGDVKLAGVIGALLAYRGVRTLVYGAFGSFVLGAVIALVLLAIHRADRRTLVPFGPSMLGAAIVAVLLDSD